jgi:two-component system OmpR family response regulator
MEASPHILVVDDDREIRDLLSRFLRKHGFRVAAAAEGREMRKTLETGRFDLIVLDLMMPGEDGLALCRWVRATSQVPVIMLTAVGEDTDRIIGLEMGADDYIAKPFNPRELLARIRAVLRRAEGLPTAEARKGVFEFEGWKLDTDRRELYRPDGELVPLTSGEYDLLLALVERAQRVLTRDQLLDLTRGRDTIPFDRSIDVQISRLRRKIEDDPREPVRIKTVRGGGYVFASDVSKP